MDRIIKLLSIKNIMRNVVKHKMLLWMCFLVFLNGLNIVCFWKNNTIEFINTTILCIILLVTFDFKKYNINKKSLLIAILIMAFMGPIMETLILHFTNNGSWKYGNPSFNWYVPIHLFLGYGMMAFTVIVNYEYIKNYILN